MSFSGSILPQADEYLTRPSRPRKRSTDDEYFSTPSKSRWHVEGHRADQTPDPQINTLYQFILSARIGIERICFVGTSTLRSDNDCAHNTIYKPLLAISEQMQVLMRKVDNWAHNAKVRTFYRS